MDEKPDPKGCDLLLTWQSKNTRPDEQSSFAHNLVCVCVLGSGGDRGFESTKRREGKIPLPPFKFLCNKKNRKAQKEKKSYTLLKTFVKFHLGIDISKRQVVLKGKYRPCYAPVSAIIGGPSDTTKNCIEIKAIDCTKAFYPVLY